MTPHMLGTLSLPFVYDATVKAKFAHMTRTLSSHYLDMVPIQPVEVSPEDLVLASHVELFHSSGRKHDRIMRFGGNLYRRLEVDEIPIPALAVQRGLSEVQSRAVYIAMADLPPPETSLLPRYGPLSPRLVKTMDQVAARDRWQIRAAPASNHDQRWNEASVHYRDAVLVSGDEIFLRCKEPAWRYSQWHNLRYVNARDAVYPHCQFGLDRLDEVKSFIDATTNMEWDELRFDAKIHHLELEFDDASLVLDLGRQAMNFVPDIRKLTTVADRRRFDCEAVLDRVEALRRRDGPFKVSDALEALDGVSDLSQKLFQVFRLRHVANDMTAQIGRARVRLRYLDDRMQNLSAVDLDALQGI